MAIGFCGIPCSWYQRWPEKRIIPCALCIQGGMTQFSYNTSLMFNVRWREKNNLNPRARFHAFLQGVCPGFHCGVHLISSLDPLHDAKSHTAIRMAWFLKLEFEEILTGHSTLWKDTYYHWIREPIKNAQLPQNVANEASYSAPLLPYAGPKAPQSFSGNQR